MTPSERKQMIEKLCGVVGFPAELATAVAQVESAMGRYLLSPTGAKGIFQLTSIAMKDMLEHMTYQKHERMAILCGLAFLCLLQDRWEGDEAIVHHYCDPAEREAYWKKVQAFLDPNPLAGTNGKMPI